MPRRRLRFAGAVERGSRPNDPRIIEVAQTDRRRRAGVCVRSLACVMTGRRRETLQPLKPAENALRDGQPPVCPSRPGDVFRLRSALRNGELLVGCRGRAAAGPGVARRRRFRLKSGSKSLAASSNDLEAPAMRIQSVIGDVIAALSATNGAWLTRHVGGLVRRVFAIFENTAEAQARRGEDQARSPGMVGACGNAELEHDPEKVDTGFSEKIRLKQER